MEKGMSLVELQDVLGDRIKVTLREDMTPEERQTENEQSIINNGDLILRTEKLAAQNKSLKTSVAMHLIKGE